MSHIEFQIRPEARALLEDAGMASFEILMSHNTGELLSSEPRSQTFRLEIASSNSPKTFFLKRTLIHRPRKTFQALAQLRRPRTDVYREMQLAKELNGAGIPAMRILAWGEERKLCFPIRGFILSEGIAGEALDEMFRSGDAQTRRRIVHAFGEFVARLHSLGFFQTVRLKDLICSADFESSDLNLTLIDRAASSMGRKIFWSRFCLQSLARGFRRMKRDGIFFEGELEGVFAKAYAKGIAPKWKITPEKLLVKLFPSSRENLPSRILRGAGQTYQVIAVNLATSRLWNIDEIDSWLSA